MGRSFFDEIGFSMFAIKVNEFRAPITTFIELSFQMKQQGL